MMDAATTDAKLMRLANNLYFAPFPAVTADRRGRIVDYNLSMEALAGEAINGLRGESLRALDRALAPHVSRGQLIGEESPTPCDFEYWGRGSVTLAPCEIAYQDLSTGEWLGRLIEWTLDSSDDHLLELHHERYRLKLDHELKWDSYARSYDRILGLMPYYEEVLSRHLDFLDAQADGPVIDLGAGTGNLVERLVASGRSCFAVDNSRAMLDRLRSKPRVTAAIGQNLTVIEASMTTLSMLDTGTFAGASILLSLFDMEEPERALETAMRLVRPGGGLVITELKRRFDLAPILKSCEYHLKALGRFDELRGDLDRVVRSNHDLAPGSRSLFRAEDVFDVLSATGFRDLTIEDSHFGQCATIRGNKPVESTGIVRSS